MAALSLAQMLTRLNTKLSDSTDKTFTSSEKTEFLTSAYNDAEVFIIDRDTSLTTVSGQRNYNVPTGFSEITDIFIDIDTDGVGYPVARDTYDVINGVIYFQNVRTLPSDKTLIIFGKNKLDTSDNLPDLLQDYVLTLAQIEAYEFMKNKYSTRFLKNDVSMGELVTSLGQLEQKAASLRKNLNNRREIAG